MKGLITTIKIFSHFGGARNERDVEHCKMRWCGEGGVFLRVRVANLLQYHIILE